MIPAPIVHYLVHHHAAYQAHPHPRAVGASRLAQSLHWPRAQVAKPVAVEADGRCLLALVSARDRLDLSRLARAVGAPSARLLSEDELSRLFPDCEVGAEPPLSHLYSLPLVVDERLGQQERIAFAAGSHDDVIEMSVAELMRLESPQVADLAQRS